MGARLVEHVERICREEFPEAEVTGLFVLLTRLIDSVIRDQWWTFALAVVAAPVGATTIAAAVADDAKPGHLTRPGHIFPLMAQPGGVLTRAGHTEAASDYARLAGLLPAAVIADILTVNGSP